jgi:protein tyrosine/serine phosphatase
MNGVLQKILRLISPHKRLIVIGLTLFCIVSMLIAWDKFIKDYVIPKNFGVVEAGQIYRSGHISSLLIKKILMKYNIKGVISLTGDSTSSVFSNAERKAVSELGIERLIFSLRGNGTGDVNDYAKIIAVICRFQREGKPVLIHCVSGAERTGGVIAAYRLIVQGRDVGSVREEMSHYGFNPDVDINLRRFLNDNIMEIAKRLKQMGVINQVPSLTPKIRG